MRCEQPDGTKGSLRWIQVVVGEHPQLLSDAIRAAHGLAPEWGVEWVSPREADRWAEYRDADFLAVTDTGRLRKQLEDYWPSHGPQWDALGKSSDGGVVLVEAKSHLSELTSTCQAGHASRTRICEAMKETKQRFSAPAQADWLTPYYQYANRLAHLHFFLSHHVPVYLAFVYFVNDPDMNGPKTADAWRQGLAPVYKSLGLRESPAGLCNVFVDVGALAPRLTS